MKEEIKIPQMGESISEATIGSILKPSGSSVDEGDEIVELETDKVNQALYAPFAGVVNWTVKEGDTVKIGQVIGSVDSEAKGETKEEKPPPKEEPEPKKEPKAPKPSPKPQEGRRVMAEAFVEELKQTPSEPEKQKPKPSKKADGRETRRPMSKIRQTIAKRLVSSLQSAAMLTTFNEVDMTQIISLRAKYKESFMHKHGVKLGLMSFFIKAVVDGLKAFPDFNAYIDEEEIVTRHYFDIGIAVGAEKGLVVPVIRECDKLSFAEIETELAEYARKAHESKLSIEDLQGGGFTITNGGVYGSMLSTPLLNPPQVGILGMHQITKRPVVVDDAIVIRPMMYLALSYDHRLVDGKGAVQFLVHIKEVLEDPARLILDADGKI